MSKKDEFLRAAGALNRLLQVVPLLYGSLGLEQRLQKDLKADDIDVLIPGRYLDEGWDSLLSLMRGLGYELADPREHAFLRGNTSVAFASLEGLADFAGIDPDKIPVTEENGVRYLLLDLPDYLKVYTASSRDGYRRDKKHKQDGEKIRLIREALGRKEEPSAPPGVTIREAELTDAVLDTLIAFSKDWEAENSCFGYRANTPADLRGRRVFLACGADGGEKPAGYLFGRIERSQRASSVMPEGTSCFEIEELYVVPACRSRGIGAALFRFAAGAVRDEAEYITLSTAAKNWRAILHFYLEELDMTFWSARLFKKL